MKRARNNNPNKESFLLIHSQMSKKANESAKVITLNRSIDCNALIALLGKNIVNEPTLDTKKLKEAKQTLLKKKEADLDHPHQLDRHSGTGISAYE